MDIYQKVKKLNLPEGKYIVIAGAALEGYGIRKSNDVDICVTKDVYRNLVRKGWKEITKPNGLKALEKDYFDIGININYSNYHRTVENLYKTATNINGVTFASLDETISFKKAMNREKDNKDIQLIKEYLNRQADKNS